MTDMQTDRYLYTYVRQTDDHDLCRLEMRALFGKDTGGNYLFSDRCLDPERSPFMKERLDILFAADSVEEITRFSASIPNDGKTFQIRCLNTMDLGETKKIPHPERRRIERAVGLPMAAEADLFTPDTLFGVVRVGDLFLFGSLTENTASWRNHIQKPEMYSTALSTHVARAVANIAVPQPEGIRAIDPCCGIGNVLVEARSMDIDMVGRDINPLAVLGSRKNLEHFGLAGIVAVGPIEEAAGHYDAAVIDMPYNLYTHATREQQASILQAARPLTDRLVLVTIEPMDDLLADAGFEVTDRCIARKAHFEREVVVCK